MFQYSYSKTTEGGLETLCSTAPQSVCINEHIKWNPFLILLYGLEFFQESHFKKVRYQSHREHFSRNNPKFAK